MSVYKDSLWVKQLSGKEDESEFLNVGFHVTFSLVMSYFKDKRVIRVCTLLVATELLSEQWSCPRHRCFFSFSTRFYNRDFTPS